MKEIKVVITKEDLVRAPVRYDLLECWFVMRLRRAGMPVKGVFLFKGVTRGVITQIRDLPTGDLIYIWRDKEELDEEDTQRRT